MYFLSEQYLKKIEEEEKTVWRCRSIKSSSIWLWGLILLLFFFFFNILVKDVHSLI